MFASSHGLASAGPDRWWQLIAAARPASMLVSIHYRMSDDLRGRISAEDIWQETLMHVWRERGNLEWRGLPAFRRLLLQVAENRLRNAADRFHAARRAGEVLAPAGAASADASEAGLLEPLASTTPSRIADLREQAAAMHRALADLPDELRDVVRLRLFEEQTVQEVAIRLGVSLPAIKHRLRKGTDVYRRRLAALLRSRSEREQE